MDYKIERMNGFKVIGFEREFNAKTSYQEIPKFWGEFSEKYMKPLFGRKPENDTEQTICDCMIGEYGVCIGESPEDENFRYIIAGSYNGGEVPEGMTVYEFPDMEWAKFECRGAMPKALQDLNTRIMTEFPNNGEYRFAMMASVEWYSKGDMASDDYESGIWVPVVKI